MRDKKKECLRVRKTTKPLRIKNEKKSTKKLKKKKLSNQNQLIGTSQEKEINQQKKFNAVSLIWQKRNLKKLC